VYRQIDRAHREWTEEQQQNLATIVRLYRGETDRFLELINKYLNEASKTLKKVNKGRAELLEMIQIISKNLKSYADATKESKRTPAKSKALKESDFFEKIDGYKVSETKDKEVNWKHQLNKTPLENMAQHSTAASLKTHVEYLNTISDTIKQDANNLLELWKIADKSAKLKTDKLWSENELTKAKKYLEESLGDYDKSVEELSYWQSNIEWLQSRFPNAVYEDVVGLCKIGNKEDYVEEQDYSLNAGRYVGILFEDDKITAEEFNKRISALSKSLKILIDESHDIEDQLLENSKQFIK